MLHIRIFRDKENKISLVKSQGHCNFAEEGKDIVCSGISAILQTAFLGLLRFANSDISGSFSKGSMFIFVNPNSVSDAILETMLIGLQEIERQYPENVSVQEVHNEYT